MGIFTKSGVGVAQSLRNARLCYRLIAARLDRDIYDWLRRDGHGDFTRINNILRGAMARAR